MKLADTILLIELIGKLAILEKTLAPKADDDTGSNPQWQELVPDTRSVEREMAKALSDLLWLAQQNLNEGKEKGMMTDNSKPAAESDDKRPMTRQEALAWLREKARRRQKELMETKAKS